MLGWLTRGIVEVDELGGLESWKREATFSKGGVIIQLITWSLGAAVNLEDALPDVDGLYLPCEWGNYIRTIHINTKHTVCCSYRVSCAVLVYCAILRPKTWPLVLDFGL